MTMTRLFKFSIQDEPFGRRWFVSGKKSASMKIGNLETASHYTEKEVGPAVEGVRDAFGSGVILTVL